jgi:hypothetical protein
MTNSSVYASPVTAKEWRVNSNNMAARRKAPCSSEDLFCSICEVGFPFRSKYKRHLASDSHQRFSDLLSLSSNEAITSTDISSVPQDSFSAEV